MISLSVDHPVPHDLFFMIIAIDCWERPGPRMSWKAAPEEVCKCKLLGSRYSSIATPKNGGNLGGSIIILLWEGFSVFLGPITGEHQTLAVNLFERG